MYSLPRLKTVALYWYSQLSQKAKSLFRSRRVKYKFAAVLDLLLIVLIIVYGRQPAQRLITPMVSSVQSVMAESVKRTTNESFAFVPDLARNKFPHIDAEGLTYLSFFDVPLTDEGEMNYSSRGYASFTSPEAAELFERARYQNTKIFLTISVRDENIIRHILDNTEVAQRLADQAVQEIIDSNIEGITLDFELSDAKSYQQKFTDFAAFFTQTIHNSIPEAKVAVAVPSTLSQNQSLYDVEALSKVSDRIFLVASDFIVPEAEKSDLHSPVYGFNAREYWIAVSSRIGSLLEKVPAGKLVMERAWYGNGRKYPLYVPDKKAPLEEGSQGDGVELDNHTLEKLVSDVPAKGKNGARKNIPLIVKALDREGILDTNVLAYALATVEHETDETFEPIDEIGGRLNARRLGYEGGENYFGRGFIQLTHLRNYRMVGERIGMKDELAKNPELASDPEVAAKVLAAFFKDNNVANLASNGNFVAARQPINPDYNGRAIAERAMKYDI